MVCVLELSSFSSCETSYEKDLENENPLGKDPVDHRLLPVAVLLRLTRRKYNLSYRIFQRTREWVWLAVVQVPCASPAWLVWKCQSCRRGEGVNSAVSLNHFLLSQRLPQPLCSRLHTCLLPGHPGVAEMRPSTLEFSGSAPEAEDAPTYNTGMARLWAVAAGVIRGDCLAGRVLRHTVSQCLCTPWVWHVKPWDLSPVHLGQLCGVSSGSDWWAGFSPVTLSPSLLLSRRVLSLCPVVSQVPWRYSDPFKGLFSLAERQHTCFVTGSILSPPDARSGFGSLDGWLLIAPFAAGPSLLTPCQLETVAHSVARVPCCRPLGF